MGDPAELEKMQVKGAIRTDFILSAEIMAIALASHGHLTLLTTAIALFVVALAITAGVYGVVAADREARRHRPALSGRRSRAAAASARPRPYRSEAADRHLSVVGTAAMLWVGGGILCMASRSCTLRIRCRVPSIRSLMPLGGPAGPFSRLVVAWLVNALGGAVVWPRDRRDHRRMSFGASPSSRKS